MSSIAKQKASLEVTLNGYKFELAVEKSISGIDKAVHDIIPCPTSSAVTLLNFSATQGIGNMATLASALIVNRDSTNALKLTIKDNSGDEATFQLDAGESFFVSNGKIEAFTDGSSFSAFSDADVIQGQGVSGTVSVEILAVGT